MTEFPSDRFNAAIGSEHPFETLVGLATALRDGGMSQRDMYDLFDRHRAAHHDDADGTRHDVILDVMDLIVGWCSPRHRLFDTDLPT